MSDAEANRGVSREGDFFVLPGLATAHSHAFQRALRGRTQRRSSSAGSFWSWRSLMYELARKLDPDMLYALSRFAFMELAKCGVTAVGEFHYVHHDPFGQPYDDRLLLSDAVIRAARDVGLRITLLRVLYHRASATRPAEGVQRRFADESIDAALEDVEKLEARYASDPLVRIGLAPHSVRAVPRSWIGEAARFAAARAMPFHMHVAEQQREIYECLAEYGLRPVELLEHEGVLDERFVAVHATHLAAHEVRAFGRARSIACICRTTERDLGDGLPNLADLHGAGVRLCTGVDSHASSDPFEEARAMELDERSRLQRRHAALGPGEILAAATSHGYTAIGFEGAESQDRVELRADDLAILGADADWLVDAVVYGGSPRAVANVSVNGVSVVRDGDLPAAGAIMADYRRALAVL